MTSRAGGLYGGIQFSSTNAFLSPTGPQETSTTAEIPAVSTSDAVREKSIPAQTVTAASTSTNATADSGASVKASAGISSYSTALKA